MNSNSKQIVKLARAIARALHKGMPAGGKHGTKKGRKGYTRKEKHRAKCRDG